MEKQPSIIAILGTGVWGSALGKLLSNNQHQVLFWSRSNSTTLTEIIPHSSVIVSAISIKGVQSTINKLKNLNLTPETIIVTATKGLDPDTTKTPSQIWQQAFPHNPVVVLSGPNLSKEIDRDLPAATTVASNSVVAAETIQAIFSADLFRVYVNQDPLGTELGGTLKNIMAIAAGVCDGMKLGTNAKAALLTRALPEMIQVGTHLGAKAETFFGLSGLGDLIATCDSPLSRNYQVGYGLAQRKTLEEILSDLEGTAEGINTTQVLIKIAHQKQIAVPIAHQVNLLLKGKITPQQAVKALMARELKAEFHHLDGK
ncbi:NAD(P)H-dependent glycerol-3-phosphate dehydrogenase [Hyella patelloides]|uniref:NAD(P)H-dependent glycerol-3-phosphate dehydrogenase n=1 Tax=Hyella patelloides TaxID=1982969 RepID=UPI00119E3715|nr:NAD(P)H-dependent glycerol-3-phosphate dehydrogenase [Hyella patelloides]